MSSLLEQIKGFTFNNKHNHDANVVMHEKSINTPSKKKIKETVPFMNGTYDFSTVGSNGEIVYEEREITIILGLPETTQQRLQVLYSKTLEWLVDVGQKQLIFDDNKDYYYLAEVDKVDTFETVQSFGQLTVTFTAYPFKFGVNTVGNEEWDTFNFLEDKLQDTEFDVDAMSTLVNIYNPGRRSVVPIISVDAPMDVKIRDYTANLSTGDNKDYSFKIKPGDNIIEIIGVGHIKFIFRKESL
jgi:predicted phage tail component-like protein